MGRKQSEKIDLFRIYDLFFEKEDLLIDSVREAAEKQARIREIDDRLEQAFSLPGIYNKFRESLSRQVRIRHDASIVQSLDKFVERTDLLDLKLAREAQSQGRGLTAAEKKFIKDNKILKQEAIQKRQKLLDDFEVFSRVRFLELKEYRQQLREGRFGNILSRKEAFRNGNPYVPYGRASKLDPMVHEAKKIMGRDFFGVEAIEKAFGMQLDPDVAIPRILFSKERLKLARLQDQFLILRIGKMEKQLLTMSKMEVLLQSQFDKENKGKVLYDMRWYRNQIFFNDMVLRSSWALVSKKSIPNSMNKNYLEQTEALVVYLRSIFGKAIPSAYADAILEFEKKKKNIKMDLSSNLGEASETLSTLKINQMMRHNADEAFYDDIVYFQNTGNRLLENQYAWTNTRSSCGRLVLVGPSDANGVRVGYWEPVDFLPRFGVYASVVV